MDQPGINSDVYSSLIAMLPEKVKTLDGKEPVTGLADFVSWFEELLNNARPGVAWQLGQRCDYRRRGILGQVVLNAGTLGAALNWLCKFYPLVQDATRVKLEIHDDVAMLNYRILDPNIWPRHQDALYSLGVFSSLIREADPEAWPKARILLEASQREARGDLSSIVHAPVTYDALTNAIAFPASALDKPLRKNWKINQDHIKHLARCLANKNRSMSIAERARYVILSDLVDSHVCQEHVARELCISSRTLRRKLSLEGVSYQELLDECRMQLAAREFATTSKASLSQMALKLGYSEHSTFTRAFGRWSGMAPRDYRTASASFKCTRAH